jgi:hypothetical protein
MSDTRRTPTTSHPQKKQPYIVREIDSRMLRKNPNLSKGARMLWLTMLSMADAKTGELRHREHWYCGKEIDRRAEISDRTRQQQIKELVRVGLVRMERERTEGMLTDRLTGRKRWRSGVLGEVHYTVFKSPHKDWFSDTPEEKSPRKHWGSSKVQLSQPLESRNTPNKTKGRNHESPHKQRVSTTRKFYHAGRISATSTSELHHKAGVGVCDDPLIKRNSLLTSSSSSAKPDDDDSRTAIPEQVIPETPSARIQRFKESAFAKINSKHGNLFSETDIRESLDDFEIRAGSPPNSDNYFVTCFENEISDLEFKAFAKKDREQSLAGSLRNFGVDRALFENYCKVCEAVGYPIKIANDDEFRVVTELKKLRNAGQSPTAVLEQAIITSSYTLHAVENRSHDDLLKDGTNFGKLLWGGRYIVAGPVASVEKHLSYNTVQAMTGCSAEHMVEHLRAAGFWAEVYTRADCATEKTET